MSKHNLHEGRDCFPLSPHHPARCLGTHEPSIQNECLTPEPDLLTSPLSCSLGQLACFWSCPYGAKIGSYSPGVAGGRLEQNRQRWRHSLPHQHPSYHPHPQPMESHWESLPLAQAAAQLGTQRCSLTVTQAECGRKGMAEGVCVALHPGAHLFSSPVRPLALPRGSFTAR